MRLGNLNVAAGGDPIRIVVANISAIGAGGR